jgi:thioredoxin-dependent peroxiredoxin
MEAYGAWGDKVLYGKKSKGIIRSTVVIQNGKVAKHWPKVSVKGHVDDVVATVKELAKSS